nr:MAG TPA: bifunctional protein PutA [Caudoviricetes sp.]
MKYKKHTRTGESSVKSVHLYIDLDLLPVLQAQPNKTRFINDAIRFYIKKRKK